MPRTIQQYIHRVGRTARAGKAGRSVSLASESERLMVKELVKNSRNPVKSRVIPVDIIEKYRNTLEQLQKDVQRVIKEGQEEKRLLILENQINKTMKKLKGTGDVETTSTWFQTDKERKDEQRRLKHSYDETEEKTVKRKKKRRISMIEEDKNDDFLQKTVNYQARSAKRKRKPKKLYKAIAVVPVNEEEKKKKKKQSSLFANDMTVRSRKALKNLQQQTKTGSLMQRKKKIPNKTF